jgi:hypothetical protein
MSWSNHFSDQVICPAPADHRRWYTLIVWSSSVLPLLTSGDGTHWSSDRLNLIMIMVIIFVASIDAHSRISEEDFLCFPLARYASIQCKCTKQVLLLNPSQAPTHLSSLSGVVSRFTNPSQDSRSCVKIHQSKSRFTADSTNGSQEPAVECGTYTFILKC